MKKLIITAVASCMFLSSAVVADPLDIEKYLRGTLENLEGNRVAGTLGFWNTIKYKSIFDVDLMIVNGEDYISEAKTSIAQVKSSAKRNEIIVWCSVIFVIIVSTLIYSK